MAPNPATFPGSDEHEWQERRTQIFVADLTASG